MIKAILVFMAQFAVLLACGCSDDVQLGSYSPPEESSGKEDPAEGDEPSRGDDDDDDNRGRDKEDADHDDDWDRVED